MKTLYLIIGLLLIIALNSTINASSSASGKLGDLRTESIALLGKLSTKTHISSSDREKIEKNLNKLFKSFEKKFLSSKSSTSIGDLKESFEKYSGKIRSVVAEMTHCSAENQVIASTLIQTFLNEFMDVFELNERVSQQDDILIETLRRYPAGTIAAHYTELWNTLNALEARNLPADELRMFIDSAILSFSERFVTANRRDFAVELADEVIGPCIIGGICETFNRSMDKLNDLQDISSSGKKEKSGDSSDES